MPEELDLLKFVCQNLERINIPYMLTGSFAANFYANPRMTRDIDIIIEIHTSDINKLLQAFQKDFYIDKEPVYEAIEYQSMFNIIHIPSSFKVDFIIRKDSAYRSIEFQRKRRVLLDQSPIWIVSPEDLIISKLDWAKDSLSEMQLKDVKNLLLSLKNLDKEYISEWVQKLGLNHVYNKVQMNG